MTDRIKNIITLLIFVLGIHLFAKAQDYPPLNIDFTVNGQLLRNPMVGGLNSPQFSAVDLNNDGVLDMHIFDRLGEVHLTYINGGTPDEVDYDYAPEYARHFPKCTNWVLLRDFDEDGAMDIFAYSDAPGIDGIIVYKGYYENNALHFERFHFYNNEYDLIYFPLSNGVLTNLYISTEDYPAVDDIDSDGDLDIITFGNGGGYIYWFRNTSVEDGFGKDSLIFVLEDDCLGHAYESGITGCLDLSPTTDSCATGFMGDLENRGGGVHAGSTLMLYDEDNDGDKEIVLGDVSGEEILRAINGGDSNSPWWTEQDCTFPSYDEPAYVITFPASFYVDVNNDGKRDLLVSPNRGELAEDTKNVLYYKNTGTDEEPAFSKITDRLFVKDVLDMGTGARPAVADFNNDGLLDLLIGNETYYVPGGQRDPRLFLYHNVGTATEPAFELVDDDYLSLSEYPQNYALAPAIGDLDSDGDLDLIVGEDQGKLFFFENTAGAGNAMTFAAVQFPYMGIDIGQVAVPQIVDLDRDGLSDLVIGTRNGNLIYFPNVGSAGSPSFVSDMSTAPNIVSLGLVDTRLGVPSSTGYASPFFVDFEGGEYALFCGSRINQIIRYGDIDGNLNGAFSLEVAPVGGVQAGFRTHLAMADLNNNGVFEMIVGNRRGGISIYHTGIKLDGTISANNNVSKTFDISLQPNPVRDIVYVDVLGIENQEFVMEVYDCFGRKVLQQKNYGASWDMDVHALTAGIYYCRVRGAGLEKVMKFVKI